MTDILELLVAQQGQGVGQGNQEIGENRALERFQKFFPPKFAGGPDPEVAENWLENIRNIFDALDYSEEREVKELRNKKIPLVKVLWKNHGMEEATWELEEEMQKKYPDLFT
ncbi:uncharacterized protein [Coffea arabica]|uniref:Uncharacterized protein n=1 Tax=Coffea arabica TaxID=13443 RepID=A0ABM4X549_COFAR